MFTISGKRCKNSKYGWCTIDGTTPVSHEKFSLISLLLVDLSPIVVDIPTSASWRLVLPRKKNLFKLNSRVLLQWIICRLSSSKNYNDFPLLLPGLVMIIWLDPSKHLAQFAFPLCLLLCMTKTSMGSFLSLVPPKISSMLTSADRLSPLFLLRGAGEECAATALFHKMVLSHSS